LSNKALFLTLRTFSITGGIEKVSKLAGKVLFDLSKELGYELKIFSMYDRTHQADGRYFPKRIFRGFKIKKASFVLESVFYGKKCDVVVLSHINLLPAGYLIKLLSPETKLILIAHGIEVWEPLSSVKLKMLNKCDKILPVSQFTKEKLVSINGVAEEKITVINNCLDPYLQPAVSGPKDPELLKKYGLGESDTVLMTLTRLASGERYKGYDKVMESMAELNAQYTNLKYLLVGKCDSEEKKRLGQIIQKYGLQKQVVFAGFIPDSQLAEHFNLADIYIMPSEKEGFGIVFIEAMHYGKPVIAGNKDGSVDALLHGKLGLLVNPENEEEISCAIKRIAEDPQGFVPDKELLREHFSFERYKERWKGVLWDR
jgi:glycosyltransferase involved in cell wall biosynthesis